MSKTRHTRRLGILSYEHAHVYMSTYDAPLQARQHTTQAYRRRPGAPPESPAACEGSEAMRLRLPSHARAYRRATPIGWPAAGAPLCGRTPRFPAPPVRLGPAPGHRHGTSNPPLRASIDHMKSISNPQIYMYKCNSRGGRACRCWTLRSKPTSKPQTQSYHNGVETHASRILPKWMTRDSRLGRCAVFLDMFIDDVLV